MFDNKGMPEFGLEEDNQPFFVSFPRNCPDRDEIEEVDRLPFRVSPLHNIFLTWFSEL